MYTGQYRDVSDEDILRTRRQFTRGFTEHHQRLVDICIGRCKPPNLDEIQPLNLEQLDYEDLIMLKMMVEVEFSASLEKEMKGTEDAGGNNQEPHAYDVFLMETTMDRGDLRLAVCMPTKTNDLVWYNGFDQVWEMDPPHHKWRVASLSGTARIMAALCESPGNHPLMSAAMKRELIVDAVEEDDDGEGNRDVDLEAIQHLNESQRQAVRTVVSPTFDIGFFVIQGPPGTGKTTTLVGMISALLKKGEKVLVTAPSNAAVANIALKLWTSSIGKCSFEDILVFGENCDKMVHFLSPRHRGVKFSKLRRELEGAMRSAEQDKKRREFLKSEQDKKRREFLKWLKLDESDDRTLADLSYLCPFIDTSTVEGRNYYSELVSQSSVVFSTLNSAGSRVLRSNFPASIILLDEAGQCPEAEFHIVTTYSRTVKKVCVIGDPQQLPSTVIEPKCKIAGYGKSWLENMFQLYRDKVHLLDTQYRMDPAILKFPNRAFYQNRILSGDNVLSRDPFVEKPVLFVDTDRRGHEEISNFSWQNLYEVTVIKYLLFNDPDIVRVLQEKRNARVIIITPYKAQAKLLKEHIKLPGIDIEIATVDSFQGQEGDIVIIATVRTHHVGFVDDAQRLNVALTRAKRILRIVGDAAFFDSISSRSSTLRKLASYARGNIAVETTAVRAISWSRPNWKTQTLWKPTMTQRFQHCLHKMTDRDKNICLNTLFAIAQGDEMALYAKIPPKHKPSWYISCLRGHTDRRIVWIAKQLDVQAIEAHFAGSYKECLRFTQTHHDVPQDACIAGKGLRCLIERQDDHEGMIGRPELFVAWRVTNTTQNAVITGGELPAGSVQLDIFQEQVACSSPPLIIESRSGTGKTLVLLQHAAYHSDSKDKRPACFMTVSQRLRNELEQRYRAIDQLENLQLPETIFITFDQLLLKLLLMRSISDFTDKSRCTYIGFEGSKTSYQPTLIEPHLVENEIGGVINGSVTAAKQRAPLSRDQYIEDLRSNIGYETESDISLRNQVYDEYEKYVAWKRVTNKFDVGDVVLRLLGEEWKQHFASAYLDECQDLSYATIYLICSIAGRDTLRWVCAGDPAQMISPGCSFTFDGLKQTLLAVESGIEKKLSEVSHLLVNYRTTKEVLHLANEVLAVARKEFPGSIPFARAEVAKKDLGLKVVLCEWKTALEQEVRLGINQAIVYSSRDAESLEKLQRELTDWIGEHPFIVSSLQSKGLEFDDVIVAFDHERKVWNMSKREASLCMLRELYVAITRAQRRVIILVKKSVPEMERFYDRLECEFQVQGAELVLKSMDTVATAEQWLEEANGFFADENFEMAMRCFGLGGKKGWMHWSSGKGFETKGNDTKAGEQFLLALESFAMEGDYDQVLEVSLALARPSIAEVSQWGAVHSDIVKDGLSRRPNHLNRFDLVRLALVRSLWDEILMDDLKDEKLASLFLVYRKNETLKRLVKTADDEDKRKIELVLPFLIGDLHLDRGNYSEAVRIFLTNRSSLSDAEETSKIAMRETSRGQQELIGVVRAWESASREPRDPRVSLLLELFRSPRKLAASRGTDILRHLGRVIVIIAVDTANEDRTILYEFSRDAFRLEVTETLATRFPREPLKVVWWFLDRKDTESALDFVHKQLKGWKDNEILILNEIFFANIPSWLIEATKRRKLFPLSIVLILASTSLTHGKRNEFLRSLAKVDREFMLGDKQLAIAAAWALNEIVLDAEAAQKKGKKAARNRIEPSQLHGNHLKVFSHQLLALWPNQANTTKQAGPVEERLTNEVCRLLLDVVLDQSSADDVTVLVNALRQVDSTAKSCIPILAFYLKRDDLDAAKSMTSGVLHCKKVSDHDLFGVACLWSSHGGTKSVVDVLNRTLLSSKQKEDVMEKLPSLVYLALRDRRIDMAWDVTCVAGSNYARLRPQAIITILKAWNDYHWTCSDGKSRSMIYDARSIVSFLRLIHATVKPTPDLPGRNIIYQQGDENQCSWLSALLLSFGPSVVGAVKLHSWHDVQQKETDKCILGTFARLQAHHEELRQTIRRKAMACVGSAQKLKKNKPLTLEEKMAQALINGKTFTPSRATAKVIASKPTIPASSASVIPRVTPAPPGPTSTADTRTADWWSDASHAVEVAAAAVAPDWASTTIDQQKKKKKNNKKNKKKKK